MLYGNGTLLEEVTATLLSNKSKKRPNQDEQEGSCFVVIGRKEKRKEKSGLVKGISLSSQERSLEEGLQVSTRMVEEKANCRGRRSRGCIGHLCVNGFHK